MKVKVKVFDESIVPFEQKGNWIDLKIRKDVQLKAPVIKRQITDTQIIVDETVEFHYELLPLNIAMTLPKWYKVEIKPRSSSFKNYGFLQTNSIGEIEADYCEEYKLPVVATRNCQIRKGERVCQFQIKLREDAPWYAKIYDLFRKEFEFEYVKELTTTRSGLGSTGK